MSAPAPIDDIEEQPLDPAVERVRRRMMRLMMISIGIMMIGLMAVLFAIVYKLGNTGDNRAAARQGNAFDTLVPVPAGGRILSTAMNGDRLSVLIEDEAGRASIIVLDLESGRQTGRFTFATP